MIQAKKSTTTLIFRDGDGKIRTFQTESNDAFLKRVKKEMGLK